MFVPLIFYCLAIAVAERYQQRDSTLGLEEDYNTTCEANEGRPCSKKPFELGCCEGMVCSSYGKELGVCTKIAQEGPCKNGLRYKEDELAGLPHRCRCFACFQGEACDRVDDQCPVPAHVAEADLNRKWFQENNVYSYMGLHYQMPYRIGFDTQLKEEEMDKADDLARAMNERVRKLHDMNDNLPGGTKAYPRLIFGAGAAQLVAAAIHAMSDGQSCAVTAQRPHWYPFKMFAASSSTATWVSQDNASDGCSVELMTVPNNPDHSSKSPLSWTKNRIYDLVYNWPAYGTPVLTSKDAPVPVAIFSSSKTYGLSSSRFGWAFVKDPAVAQRMADYIMFHGSSSDAQYRQAVILKAILDHPGADGFMASLQAELTTRWRELSDALRKQGVFKIATRGWSQQVQVLGAPTPLFAWIQSPEGSDCTKLMADLKIKVSPGQAFDAPSSFCRMNLGPERAVFDLLLQRLQDSSHKALLKTDS
mmetsp:Transcript_20659/g.37220  ORF Transcript_20659/g.37220 Transcript_20659/m.37220 type:complete len:476 (-) Transcript_20659:265-1692(-)|eukprot:CAMPEP_0197628512 /NCGR_PEP_ID=MMETSP1338-20131121/6790_1 /TAXON_ID=43686 ORGANISM="Pelagodinium beii, Strain RCC1491" /NCGR_SAMPLE_ID=MMETSP1338 /ASSEMBLY_ACC=CAM_ASM_000754 /LENGTH=475 /DNA_ID=CAMNT_0043199495 /DNA_START=63 /DNA_END=1490 /DNA_ORIENTATION=-